MQKLKAHLKTHLSPNNNKKESGRKFHRIPSNSSPVTIYKNNVNHTTLFRTLPSTADAYTKICLLFSHIIRNIWESFAHISRDLFRDTSSSVRDTTITDSDPYMRNKCFNFPGRSVRAARKNSGKWMREMLWNFLYGRCVGAKSFAYCIFEIRNARASNELSIMRCIWSDWY